MDGPGSVGALKGTGIMVECLMRMTYNKDANAAYLAIEQRILKGSAVENVVVERPGRGDIILAFDADGRLLGVEVIGAEELLSSAVLAAADK
jgi:uncharacterized protein YuzE